MRVGGLNIEPSKAALYDAAADEVLRRPDTSPDSLAVDSRCFCFVHGLICRLFCILLVALMQAGRHRPLFYDFIHYLQAAIYAVTVWTQDSSVDFQKKLGGPWTFNPWRFPEALGRVGGGGSRWLRRIDGAITAVVPLVSYRSCIRAAILQSVIGCAVAPNPAARYDDLG